MFRELGLGLVALAVAAAYYAAAAGIPRSLLADAVGADGVPKGFAVALGVLGALQLARTALRPRAGGGPSPPAAGTALHLKAGGMLAIGIAYVAAMPYLGYPLAVAALVFVVTAYAGVKPSLRLGLLSAAAGLGFWVIFVKLLGVAMPDGAWRQLAG